MNDTDIEQLTDHAGILKKYDLIIGRCEEMLMGHKNFHEPAVSAETSECKQFYRVCSVECKLHLLTMQR